ncbi:NifB/NifX family molybdenum-iron cluster-binding protein [Rhodoplanes serenus]|uniref:NifB/NifX family molybdenum-iron cluster-binding protein n=1 Tax=Rhodoplanes serenus TaxID=200615 RepID=UPI000DADB48C|nr:NifB/NifX family molybdenum-iron cluster-binding protein [Rhodoplanes serenus]RAI33151.1 nitrogen fixation protein [Rhodoplanes serenus]
MRIAVASQNFRTVTGHAGRTRRFLVFEAEQGVAPREVDRLDLPKELAMHEFHGSGPHPLDVVQALIAGSAGPGFIRRMAGRGITAVATSETDPVAAVTHLLAGTLPAAPPHDHDCNDHGHPHHHHHDDEDGGTDPAAVEARR